jgi:methylthioribose-1-phosphate isomerase
MLVGGQNHRAVSREKAKVHIIDQSKLPFEFVTLVTSNYRQTCEAIRRTSVRGPQSVALAASYAYLQASYEYVANDYPEFLLRMKEAKEAIISSCPPSSEPRLALMRMEDALKSEKSNMKAISAVEKAADALSLEIIDRCRKIGMNGLELVPDKASMLTHGNAGALSSVDYGTALSVIRAAHGEGKAVHVYVCETRPQLQGAVTAWELLQEGIGNTVISDSAAGFVFQKKKASLAIVGADRICANGDFSSRSGTFQIALSAKECGVPFYVAAPSSAFDSAFKTGESLEVEMRPGEEMLKFRGLDAFPRESKAENPSSDITPGKLVTAFITEKGVFKSAKDALKA